LNSNSKEQALFEGQDTIKFDQSLNISLHILQREELSRCSFWVGVFKSGELTPFDLLDSSSVTEIFLKAAHNGLKEQEALFLTDNKNPHSQARFFYFLPFENLSGNAASEGIAKLVDTLKNMTVKEIGLFLSPEIYHQESIQTLLKSLISSLIKETAVREYHLYPGSHGTNQILNVALDLKADLETEASKIYIFH
jgi:hypothetical protein